MKIEWNKVTWYSTLSAVIIFVLTFCVGFELGKYTLPIITISKSIEQQPNNIKPINIVSYTCNTGKVIIAKYYQRETKPAPSPDQPPVPGGSITLNLSDGRFMTLPQTISADGERYANQDESFVFWGKGNGAFITEGNENNTTYKNCVVSSQTANQ
jgi:membrane-bound inhibitor of C-type lysozyme